MNACPTFQEIVRDEKILEQARNLSKTFQNSEKNENVCSFDDSLNVYIVLLSPEKDLISQMYIKKKKNINSGKRELF